MYSLQYEKMIGGIHRVSVVDGDLGCCVLWLCNFFTTFWTQVPSWS